MASHTELMSLREDDDGAAQDLDADVEQAGPKKVKLFSSSFKKLALGVALVGTLCIGAALYPKPQDTLTTRFLKFRENMVVKLQEVSEDLDRGKCELIVKEHGADTPDGMGLTVSLVEQSSDKMEVNIQIDAESGKEAKLVSSLQAVLGLVPVPNVTDMVTITQTEKGAAISGIGGMSMGPPGTGDIVKAAKPDLEYKFFVGRSFEDHIDEWSKAKDKPWPTAFAGFHTSGAIKFTEMIVSMLTGGSSEPMKLMGVSLDAIYSITSTNTIEYDSEESLETMVSDLFKDSPFANYLFTLSQLEGMAAPFIPDPIAQILDDLEDSMDAIKSVDFVNWLQGFSVHIELTNFNPMPVWDLVKGIGK